MLSNADAESSDEVFYDYKSGKEVSSINDFKKENWDGPGNILK